MRACLANAAKLLSRRSQEPLLLSSADLPPLFERIQIFQLPLITRTAPRAKALEAFASLDAGIAQHASYIRALRAIGADSASGETWMVVAAHEGAGGTSTAVALASQSAAQGRRVVLVDADMSRRRLHTAFGVEPRPGLAEILQHETSWPVALTPLESHRFLLLPAGIETAALDALATPAVAATLDELRSYYDLVVVVLPAQALTLPGLLPLADRALLVARTGCTALPTYAAQLRTALAEQPQTSAVVITGE
jgi:Mrp family chromosome partitioning ATPase